MTRPLRVDVSQWRSEIQSTLDDGARFGTLYATAPAEVRCVLVRGDGGCTSLMVTGTPGVPSIVDIAPAAAWSEREARDVHGTDFPGHDPLRPLNQHSSEWRVPVSGGGVHELAVGPTHAGIIESGHFRLHTVGERILHLDLRLFYKHRGLERCAEGASLEGGLRVTQRACAACTVTNGLAYVTAAEQVMRMPYDPDIARTRTILLELERVWNHLNDLSAMCAGVGFAAGAMAFAALKEEAQRLNHDAFGHRFLFGTVRVGGSGVILSAAAADAARACLTAIGARLRTAWRALIFNASVQDRFRGVGVLARHTALHGGAVGPVARASGINCDARTAAPTLCYAGFVPAAPGQPSGDVAARAEVRYAELEVALGALDRLLAGGLTAVPCPRAVMAGELLPPGLEIGVGRIEGPRGETLCCLEMAGDGIGRVHLRTGSYANWPVLAEALPGNVLGEFPLINKSFELCYACVDR
ncbi:MAG: hydrogenase large subunit [Candidatus Dormibacteria bacterium]